MTEENENNEQPQNKGDYDKGKIRAAILKAIAESKARGELSDLDESTGQLSARQKTLAEKMTGDHETKVKFKPLLPDSSSAPVRSRVLEEKAAPTTNKKSDRLFERVFSGLKSFKRSVSSTATKPDQTLLTKKTEQADPGEKAGNEQVKAVDKAKTAIKKKAITDEPVVRRQEKVGIKKDQTDSGSFPLSIFNFSLNLVITLILLSGLLIILVGVGIYKNSFFSTQTRSSIVEIIPFPAGIVNKQLLTISEFRADVAALNRFYAVQVEAGFYDEFPSGGDVQDIIWEKFVTNALMNDLADEYNVVISDEMVRSELETVVAESGSYENLEKQIAFMYGWSINKFAQKVIRPFLLQEALAAVIFKDNSLRVKKTDYAQELGQLVKKDPDNFAAYAEKYSQDEVSRRVGGDLGYFVEGVIVPEIEKVLKVLSIGEVSSVLESGEGYEIVKLEDRILGNDGRLRFKARRILIRYPTFEELLNEKRQAANIYRFVN